MDVENGMHKGGDLKSNLTATIPYHKQHILYSRKKNI